MTQPRKNASDTIANQSRLAEEINRNFKIPCTRQTLQRWQKQHDPPFPPPDAGGRYSRSECFTWVEKNIIEPMKKEAGAVNPDELLHKAVLAEAQRKIDRARREKALADNAEGLTIFRTEARAKAMGVLNQYHSFVRVELEEHGPNKRRAELQKLGIPADTIAAFYAFDLESEQKRIDRIAARCAAAAKEPDAIAI